MDIIVNGKPQTLLDGIYLEEYITKVSPHPDRIIAEVNELIIKRKQWADYRLNSGDRVELVTLVGGG